MNSDLPPAAGLSASGRLLMFSFFQLTRLGLRGVWVSPQLPEGPCVWAANHHSWWDGFVGASILRQAGHRPSLLMDPDNLSQFAFLRNSGVLATTQPRAALTALRGGSTLIIFPERVLRGPGPLGPCHPGATWFAAQAGVPLVAAAVRVVNRGHQFAEAYISVASVAPAGQDEGLALQSALGAQLAELDAQLSSADPSEPLPGFTQLIRGRRSWDERVGAWTGRSPR